MSNVLNVYFASFNFPYTDDILIEWFSNATGYF